MAVEIYTKEHCLYCKKAKTLLEENDIPFIEIDAGNVDLFRQMQERLPGVRKLPQIIIDGHHIGSFDVLEAHQNAIFKKYQSNQKLKEPVLFKDSQTEHNLVKAFVGECVARMRYGFFAAQAKKDGFVQIAHVFEETAEQEKAHASRMQKFLKGREVKITESLSVGGRHSTEQNLRSAAQGEQHESQDMYPAFAQVARNEGFDDIADVFDNIAIAERQHAKRFLELADNIAKDRSFKRETEVTWRCRNCGFVHDGLEAPLSCPACAHPQGHFEILGENW